MVEPARFAVADRQPTFTPTGAGMRLPGNVTIQRWTPPTVATTSTPLPKPAGRAARAAGRLRGLVARIDWMRVAWVLGRVLGVLLALAAVAGLVWLIVWLVATVVALVAAAIAALVAWLTAYVLPLVLGVLGVVVFIALLTGGGSHRCAGLHCGGCRR